jgi:hypothetical protein
MITEIITITKSRAYGDNLSFIFEVDGEMVAIGHMPAPIPAGEIEATANTPITGLLLLKT